MTILAFVNALLLGLIVWHMESIRGLVSTLLESQLTIQAKNKQIERDRNQQLIEQESKRDSSGPILTWSPEIARERNARFFQEAWREPLL